VTAISSSSELIIRCGLDFAYDAVDYVPMILVIQPQSGPGQRIEHEQLDFSPNVPVQIYQDVNGNIVHRLILPPGRTSVRHDAMIAVPSLPENHGMLNDQPVQVPELTPDLLRYILPSRYCDSDRLMDFAFQQFGHIPHGLPRVQAICDWLHNNIEYRFGSGSPHITASEVIQRRYGVCRDFAHCAVALSRCFNIPTRYVTGLVPDVAYDDPGTPMDFHAYMEVYVGHRWHTYDARFNVPRMGRVKIAAGLDAVDGAFSTVFGAATLALFQVWSYQVDPDEVHVGDPIDMSKRLDGTTQLRLPPRILSARNAA
jgi:transglutaminase-like putative cysteine protease